MLGMGGMDPDVASAIQNLLKELSCPICLSLYSLPTQTPCGHTFCHTCIQRALRPRTNDDSQDLHMRPAELGCPLCKHKCNKRTLEDAPILVQKVVERMRELLVAFQQATGGITCSQYPPVKPFHAPLSDLLPSIPEEQEVEVAAEDVICVPSSPGELFRSLEELKGSISQAADPESDVFETQQQQPYQDVIPETQLEESLKAKCDNTTMSRDILETQLEGITSSPGVILKSPIIVENKIIENDKTPVVEKIATQREKKTPTTSEKIKTSVPTTNEKTRSASRTPVSDSSAKKRKRETKSTEFKNPSASKKKCKEEVSTPTERNKKKKHESKPVKSLCTSMLSKDSSSVISLFCDMFQVEAYNSLDPLKCSHLIVATKRKNGMLLAKRSFKYLQARLCEDVSIVSVDWIQACIEAAQMLAVDEYLVEGDEETGGVMAAPSNSNIFKGMQFYFYGEAYLKPTLSDLHILSRMAHADIITSVDTLKGKHGVVVFCSPSEDKFEKDAGVISHFRPIISCAWILDCISLGRLLNMNDYHIL